MQIYCPTPIELCCVRPLRRHCVGGKITCVCLARPPLEEQLGFHQPDEWDDYLNEPPLSPSLIVSSREMKREEKKQPIDPLDPDGTTQDPDPSATPPTGYEQEEEEHTPSTEDEYEEITQAQPRSPE